METNVNYTVVGAFCIILISFIVLGIIWLSSGFSSMTYSTYLVRMQEAVSGLTIDAPVEYNGVNVGKVSNISLNAKDPQLVDLLLSIKSGTPITQGTVATLQTRGITGITFIALKDKSNDLRPLTAEEGQPYPVIKTAPSLLLRLDTALTRLDESLSKVSKSIQSVLDEENLHSIKQILAQLDTLTRSLSQSSGKLNLFINNAAHASRQFNPAMQTITTQTLPDFNNTLSNINSLTSEIKNNPSVLIRGTQPPLPGPGEN